MGHVFVVDTGNHRIQRFDADGTYQTQWGSFGSGNGPFKLPAGVAVSGTGQVYVADYNNDRIQRFDADGTYQTQWGTGGSGDGQFDQPSGIAVSGKGQVYVADFNNDRVQRFDTDGAYQMQWGESGSVDGQFDSPRGVAVADTGQVYVADAGNHRVQRFFDSDAWVSGTNRFVDGGVGPTSVAVGPGDILGTSLTLDFSKELVVHDGTIVNAGGSLSLSGGSLITGSFENREAGTLNFYNGSLTVRGVGGTFVPGSNDFTIDGSTATDLPELVIANTADSTLSKLYVGVSKRGKLTIETGGVVSNTVGYLGRYTGSVGMVTVTGDSSQWNNSASLVLGYYGDGTLKVEAGGQVSNFVGYIGYRAGSTGLVTVTGFGSQWTNLGDLYVGPEAFGSLTIDDEG